MSLTKLESRIYRSELRMRRAQSALWRQAWCGVLERFIRERNARALVRLVRDPASSRDELAGLRRVVESNVVATSGRQSTTTVCCEEGA